MRLGYVWKSRHSVLKRSRYAICCYFIGKSNILAPIDRYKMILPLISLRSAPLRLGLIIQGLTDDTKRPPGTHLYTVRRA